MANPPFELEKNEERSSYSSDGSVSHRNDSWKGLLRGNGKEKRQHNHDKGGLRRRWLSIIGIIIVLGITATFIWLSLLLTVPHRHRPQVPSNKVSSIVDDWRKPEDSVSMLSPWNLDFTEGITPIACHSHNDYWRTVPLFEAMAAGCTSVEADIYLPTKPGNEDLLVGHSSRSLVQDRTLQSLYIEPLFTILENVNNSSTRSDGDNWKGIFQSSPNTTFVLFLDFKSDGSDLWPHVNQQLEQLRAKNWLTHWNNSSGITWAPIIVIASGNAPFDLLVLNTTCRDIFFDAPLDDIENSLYNNTNSYYASVSMSKAIGRPWLWKFSSTQLDKISEQVSAASDKGLKARYWNTPSWPAKLRDYVSGILIERRVGILNVDEFSSTFYFPLVTRFEKNRLVW
ncbi:hypothetical protein BCIN_16g00390 [Botrytis cinerea B05.10]|uniref:Altered inheritance of mitochondria protein 6 n=2 Tax=Botryotinia fuckeliana TaxID=40559 RepID=A0A384K5T6_BOTFB|nr:hypothetical protein BCIN_16g00390 [Botrytis cinerea B05.10]ATZ58185.1 hypothetical protein BCIN_16g00390 [Botrytis cinerea B05.10]CCD49395.1 hypothetical protein BofuT4_P027650.1 [Botrytis cinerea T4]